MDLTFDGDGLKSNLVGSSSSGANAVAIQSDGNIVLAGWAWNGLNDFAVVRLTSAGAYDPNFSGDGIQLTDFGSTDDYARDLLIRSDGKIVVAGNTWQSLTGDDVALARYITDGSLDTAFGTGGILAGDLTGGNDGVMALAFDSEQRIVIGGSAGDDAAVARFVPQSRVEVRNVAPVLTISGNSTIEVNTPYTLALSKVDPGTDTIAHWDINWGDGSATQQVSGSPASVPHTYTGNPRAYTITATATDEDGTFTANSLLIDSCKCGWGFRETGGSIAGAAKAVADATTVMLSEATLWKNITIAAGMTEVSVTFTNLAFPGIDLADINDAFEIAFVDANGNSLVPTIGPGRDTFFNITEGIGMSRASGVTFDGEKVTLSTTGLPTGTVGRLEVRLINNDGDVGTRTSVRILCDNQNAHQVLWGINEDTGSLFAMWNYHSAAATFVDYGQVYTMQGTPPTPTVVGINLEAFTVDGDGTAYMVRNDPVGGLAGPVLLKVDLNNLVYGNQVIATVVGRIPLTFNAAQDNISEVSFDPITGKLFALFKDEVDTGTNPVDRVLVINKSNAQIVEDLGPMTGLNTSVTQAESFAFDGEGRLFVADDVTDGLYEISPITGDIVAIVDSNLKNNANFTGFTTMKIEGLAFDPATDDLLASDDDNDRLLAFKTDATSTRVMENLAQFGMLDVEGMDFTTMFQGPPERHALWAIDEIDGNLMVFTDYRSPNTAAINFGPVRVPNATTGVMTAVTDMEAMAIDSDGTAYIALHDASTAGFGTTTPKLLKINLMNLSSLQTAVDATVVGNFNIAGANHISGLAFHPTTGVLYGINNGNSTGNEVLVTINKVSGADTTVGTMTGAGQAVTAGEDLAFDANGNLYVSDTADDDVYTISTANGAILTIYDNNVEGGLSPTATVMKGMGFDPVTGQLIGSDDTNNRFIRITSGNGANVLVAAIPTTMADAEAMAFFRSSAVGNFRRQPATIARHQYLAAQQRRLAIRRHLRANFLQRRSKCPLRAYHAASNQLNIHSRAVASWRAWDHCARSAPARSARRHLQRRFLLRHQLAADQQRNDFGR